MNVKLVSIPNGFSRSLQLEAHVEENPEHWVFQSLMGFHVRCNIVHRVEFRVDLQVSIPNGFSRSLQHLPNLRDVSALIAFQSLMGFHVRCNPNGFAHFVFTLQSFNP